MDTENIKIQIKTFFGLEQILAEEIKKLGGKNVEIKNRGVKNSMKPSHELCHWFTG